MTEGGSGSVPLANGTGSRKPKNIRILRIRIPNIDFQYSQPTEQGVNQPPAKVLSIKHTGKWGNSANTTSTIAISSLNSLCSWLAMYQDVQHEGGHRPPTPRVPRPPAGWPGLPPAGQHCSASLWSIPAYSEPEKVNKRSEHQEMFFS